MYMYMHLHKGHNIHVVRIYPPMRPAGHYVEKLSQWRQIDCHSPQNISKWGQFLFIYKQDNRPVYFPRGTPYQKSPPMQPRIDMTIYNMISITSCVCFSTIEISPGYISADV